MQGLFSHTGFVMITFFSVCLTCWYKHATVLLHVVILFALLWQLRFLFKGSWPNHDSCTIHNGEWCVQLKHLKDKWILLVKFTHAVMRSFLFMELMNLISLLHQACGLVKNLALMVYITVGSAAYPILEFLEEWGTENFEVCTFSSVWWLFISFDRKDYFIDDKTLQKKNWGWGILKYNTKRKVVFPLIIGINLSIVQRNDAAFLFFFPRFYSVTFVLL